MFGRDLGKNMKGKWRLCAEGCEKLLRRPDHDVTLPPGNARSADLRGPDCSRLGGRSQPRDPVRCI